jgi:mono/diheme cytochrome c family protein
MIEKGAKIYQMNCLSCHGPDPKKDGPIGPSIAGSSLELITMRVLELKYPVGYKPKRGTSSMVALPHLKNEIPSLFEYLSSDKN